MTQIPFTQWKAEALKYADEVYCLPADSIDDEELRRRGYDDGLSPEETITEICEKYDIQKI